MAQLSIQCSQIRHNNWDTARVKKDQRSENDQSRANMNRGSIDIPDPTYWSGSKCLCQLE